MNGGPPAGDARSRSRPPWLLIGLAAILIVLILATPGLLSLNNPTAGSPATEAVLVLDRPPVGNTTHLYVEGVSDVRYASISLGLATNLSWPAPSQGAGLRWVRWANASETLEDSLVCASNPIAVNVTAYYVDSSGGEVEYVGLYAFNTTGSTMVIEPLLPGLSSGASTLPLAALPQSMPLLLVPVGPP